MFSHISLKALQKRKRALQKAVMKQRELDKTPGAAPVAESAGETGPLRTCKKLSFLKTELICFFCISGAQAVNFAVVLASSKHLFCVGSWKYPTTSSNDFFFPLQSRAKHLVHDGVELVTATRTKLRITSQIFSAQTIECFGSGPRS